MPYNTAPIDPPSDATGTVSLPLSRVKKIIQADEDISNCSTAAGFAIAIATEIFIRHLTEQVYNIVKSERRPRRNIQYNDVANAVARIDNLEFLSDVVPRTTTLKALKEKKAKEDAGENGLSNGQRTLHQMTRVDGGDGLVEENGNRENGSEEVEGSVYEDARDVLKEHGDGHERDEEGQMRSPNGMGGVQARHNFDAVRNEFHDADDVDIPMEE